LLIYQVLRYVSFPFVALGSLLCTLIHRFWRTATLCVYVEDRIALSIDHKFP